MSKTKQKILDKALELYNSSGVSEVSIRQIAKAVGISHSNLIYHYPTHEDVILDLHELLLQKATELNQELKRNNSPLISLFQTTRVGLSVVYDFRFLFTDLQYICNTFPKIKAVIRAVESVRSQMYRDIIHDMVEARLMQAEETENEFNDLIVLIKIYSDHWLVSSSIYDELSKAEMLDKYSYLLLRHFYPYLTNNGKQEFNTLQVNAPRPY